MMGIPWMLQVKRIKFLTECEGGKSLRNNYAQICERNMNARFIFCVLGRWLRRNCFSNLTVTSLVREGCHYCGVGTFISTMEIVSRVTHMNLLCFLCPDDTTIPVFHVHRFLATPLIDIPSLVSKINTLPFRVRINA